MTNDCDPVRGKRGSRLRFKFRTIACPGQKVRGSDKLLFIIVIISTAVVAAKPSLRVAATTLLTRIFHNCEVHVILIILNFGYYLDCIIDHDDSVLFLLFGYVIVLTARSEVSLVPNLRKTISYFTMLYVRTALVYHTIIAALLRVAIYS